jgi:hypothetical protein
MILKHPLLQILLISGLFVTCFFTACEPDSDIHPCQTFDYGDIPVMPIENEPFPFHDGEVLIFKDSLDHELRMEMDTSGVQTYWVLQTTTSSYSSTCEGGTRRISNLQMFDVRFHSNTTNIELYCSFQANSSEFGDTTYFYDSMNPRVSDADHPVTGWRVVLTYVTNGRGHEALYADQAFLNRYEFSEAKNLRGKDFNKVYSKYDDDGSVLHFNHEFGFLAFRKEHGTLWVLDRTE